MALRSLLQYDDRFQYRLAVNPPTVSATGVADPAFPVANVTNTRLDKAWKVPSGGPHTLTIDYTFANSEYCDCICLLAPTGFDFVGTPTVRLRNSLAGPDLWTSSTSVRPPFGMPDRRYFSLPARTGFRYLQVVLSSGSYLSYVRHGWAMDLSLFASRIRDWSLTDLAVVQEGIAGACFYPTADVAISRRILSYRQSLIGLPATTVERAPFSSGSTWLGSLYEMFNKIGRTDPLLWMPNAEDDTSKTNNIELMHTTGMYGRLAADLEMPFAGIAASVTDDNGVVTTEAVIRNADLSFEAML